MISILGLALPFNRSSSARNWNKLSIQRKYSRQSFINNAWLIHFRVTCVTWIMLVTLPDIFTNAFFKHKNSAIGKQLLEAHGSLSYRIKVNLDPSQMPVQSLNALFAVKQRTQSTSQHNDRFHPCETPCLRMFNTFICVCS